jgi:serine/threonine-protein kinase
MTNLETPPAQGLVAGKYQLVRLIGRGGMGSVWEARHVSLGTPSAIKFIEAEYADSPEARSRFDKEAKAAATIQSKHAIQIFDHGMTDDGKPYIVMELLQGEPLDKVLNRGPLSLQETARIIQQVCRGLARAHERGIVHRDLKPENIFLVKTPDDDEPIAKVLDFGIAKIQSNDSGLTSSTKTGAVLGTPFYMSPEQARGLRNIDHRTDIWSLGVIAFKCVTGKLPFDGESIGDLLVKICTAPVPVPSQVAASLGIQGLTPSFDAWFMRALEREPERRFASVTELSDALCFAAGIHTRSQPETPMPAVMSGPSSAMTVPMSGPYGSGPAYAPTPRPSAPAASAAGALTNAPFTREEIAGVPSGKGKLVLGGILAGVVAVSGVVGVLFYLKGHTELARDATSGAAIVPPSVSVPATSADKPDEPPPEPTTTAKASKDPDDRVGASAKGEKKDDKEPETARPAPTTKLTTRPPVPPPTKPTTTQSVAPSPPPLPPPTPTKKPNKHDPGY